MTFKWSPKGEKGANPANTCVKSIIGRINSWGKDCMAAVGWWDEGRKSGGWGQKRMARAEYTWPCASSHSNDLGFNQGWDGKSLKGLQQRSVWSSLNFGKKFYGSLTLGDPWAGVEGHWIIPVEKRWNDDGLYQRVAVEMVRRGSFSRYILKIDQIEFAERLAVRLRERGIRLFCSFWPERLEEQRGIY